MADETPSVVGDLEDDAGNHWTVRLWTTALWIIRPSDLEHVLPFVLTMLACHFFFWSSAQIVDFQTSSWWVERHPLPPLTLDRCGPELPSWACERLLDQWTIASSRSLHHFQILRFYTIRYFAFLVTSFATGTAAGAAVVVVAKGGWDSADNRLKGVVLGLGCATAFFGGFPTLTLMAKNLQDNAMAYEGYDNIEFEIRTYVATGSAMDGVPVTADEPSTELRHHQFVHYVDQSLVSLNAIHVSFDEGAVSSGRSRVLEVFGEPESP